MANPSGADSKGGSFGLAPDIDDLLAPGGSVGKGSKEPFSTLGLHSLTPEPVSKPTSYGHEGMGSPDSPSAGIAESDGDFHKGQPSGLASQSAQA